MLIVIVEDMKTPKGEWTRRSQMDFVPMDFDVPSSPDISVYVL